jgi:FKBP-type peptidyl-prolyl cis-trans isomerase
MKTKYLLSFCLLLVCAVGPLGCDSTENNEIVIEPPRVVAEEDYTVTESGLKIYDFTVGQGPAAEDGSIVSVYYSVWLTDGTLLDSSYLSGSPFTFVLGNGTVIAGWEEGVVGMQVGGSRQLVVPPSLAYGAAGRPEAGIPANATLIFEIDMAGLQEQP